MAAPRPDVEALLAANTKFAETYAPTPTMDKMREGAKDPVLVLTCMDPRVVPEQFLGPAPRAAVHRNAGGRCTPDAIRSMTLLRSLAYKVEGLNVMVVHHTDCGATYLTSEGIKKDVIARNPESKSSVETMNLGIFTAEDLDKSVVEDVKALRSSDLLIGARVRGFVLSLETGLLREVEV